MLQRGGSEQSVKNRCLKKSKVRKALRTTPPIADLEKQVDVLIRELKEAREQWTATT